MGILEKITATKRIEVERLKKLVPLNKLSGSPYFNMEIPSMYEALKRSSPSIITEFKRRSPSAGVINITADPAVVAKGYQEAGASAVSVLTDAEYYGGSTLDLRQVSAALSIPVLRKDFIIDEYQVIEARSAGASAILLIGSILDKKKSGTLTKTAYELGMDVIFEIHDIKDLDVMDQRIRIIGVNNRDLGTFKTDIGRSAVLLKQLPEDSIKVAESGFGSASDVLQLFEAGYSAFLIGTHFMSKTDPAEAARDFIRQINKVNSGSEN